MLRLLWLLSIISTILTTMLPMLVRPARAQPARDDDALCYLRIEGRGTQNLARLCGKKVNQSGAGATQPIIQRGVTGRSSQPTTLTTDPDTSADDDDEIKPTPRSSPLATPSPSPVPQPTNQPSPPQPPGTRSPVAEPAANQKPTLSPTRLVPNQTPTSDGRVLPVPRLPEPRSSQSASPKSRVVSSLKPRSASPPTAQALSPQATAPTLVPSVASSPLPMGTAQTSPLDMLLQQLMQQKYLYLFWVLVLQVPLLKVAIERRSRPHQTHNAQPRRSSVAPKQLSTRLNEQALILVTERAIVTASQPNGAVPDRKTDDRSDDREATLAIATLAETPAPENITQTAEFDLSQADNQIAQIKVIIASAMRNRASDIHLEPTIEGLRVRYRIDGILRDVTMLPLAVSRRTIVALKVMADMDIAESRRPQDARISEQYTLADTASLDLDLRVSTLPCVGGEKAVIRLLPRQNPFSHMDDLGFTEKTLARYKSWLQQPQGMIIFTGPTGSGKTSTLYTSLQAIATEHVNVVTVEDPVEYILPCITQTQVNETAGMTFPAGLRAILRQDPDIIMVGEIRDGETAETAIRAALTGHLVLTTLHTNDAIGAIPRLKDMGPDPGLMSDALLGVVAQRLVRRICPHCASPYTPTESDLRLLGISLAEANPQAWRQGRGCSHCFHSGYAGREAIIELLHVDATIRQLIYDGSLSALMDYLNHSEFESFRKAAIAKITAGITTIAEIRRVLPASKLAIDS